jgi:hypothetical protein
MNNGNPNYLGLLARLGTCRFVAAYVPAGKGQHSYECRSNHPSLEILVRHA